MAVKLLLDADLPRALFTALVRDDSTLDVVRVQQVGLRTASDPEILAYAAEANRIVVTKDKATMRTSPPSESLAARRWLDSSSSVLPISVGFAASGRFSGSFST